MRVPKYQAWNKKLGKMQQVLSIDLDPEFGGVYVWGKEYVDYLTNEHEAEKDFWPWDDCEIRESTGETDKNEKETYRGDILGLDDPDDQSRAVIVFRNAAFQAELVGSPGIYDPHWTTIDSDWVIIGDIYENPDLASST